MSAFLNIVKEITGEVLIQDAITKFALKQLDKDAALFTSNQFRDGGVWIIDKFGSEFNVETSNILSTQVLPAAPVAFVGDSRALYELLESDFFYNLVNPPTTPIGGVYDEIYNIEDYAQQTNNTTTYINSLTFPVDLSIGEAYKFSFNYAVQVSRTNRSGFVRCYVESPTAVETQVSEVVIEVKDNTNYINFSPFRYITATEAGVHNVKIDFRCELTATVVRIKDQTIEVLKKI